MAGRMAPRSRTGCMTCRQRKLKCDEQRPVCGQCTKARRECIPSSGITFRHQQNPSMNGANAARGGGEGLNNFYGYKETFRYGTTWVDIPRDLTFVHTSNPYEDDEEGPGGATWQGGAEDTSAMLPDMSGRYGDSGVYTGLVQAAQAAYPAYATHGLEALSAVASQDQYSYAPPPATMGHHDEQQSIHHQQHDETPLSNNERAASPTIEHLLAHQTSGHGSLSSPSVGNIDPRLQAESQQMHPDSGTDNETALSMSATAALSSSDIEEELRMRIQS